MKDQSNKKEVLNVTMKVTEEIYKNPNYEEPKPPQKSDEGFADLDMMDAYQPEYMKKTHFEITGTVEGFNIRGFARNMINGVRGMGM